MKTFFIVTLTSAFLFTSAWGKEWGTEYVKFELPETWKCHIDGSEYTCFPEDATKRKDALIVTAAKLQDKKEDTYEKYYDYLKKPKKIRGLQGEEITSKVHIIKYVTINDIKWIDSLHESSELSQYYTRYLATIHKGIVVVLAYSTSVEKNVLYIKDLRELVKSLKVTAKIPPKED
ncbi:MAG: hypothetical protein HYW47_08030 [Deltaproteobacteria bacterium]|nr:hypothetical protein [Deltaproteobacteria bacterium]